MLKITALLSVVLTLRLPAATGKPSIDSALSLPPQYCTSAVKAGSATATHGHTRYARLGSPLAQPTVAGQGGRERICFDEGWRFYKYGPNEKTDSLFYDLRPVVRDERDDKAADSRPTEAAVTATTKAGLKHWILSTGNNFLKDSTNNTCRRKEGPTDYRLRWDEVVYAPGQLRVVAYKNSKQWAQDVIRTTSAPTNLKLTIEPAPTEPVNNDLVFVTAQLVDKDNLLVPDAKSTIRFSLEGPGEIVATDNSDATNLISFASPERAAFNGHCLVIVRRKKGQTGLIKLQAQAPGLSGAILAIPSL